MPKTLKERIEDKYREIDELEQKLNDAYQAVRLMLYQQVTESERKIALLARHIDKLRSANPLALKSEGPVSVQIEKPDYLKAEVKLDTHTQKTADEIKPGDYTTLGPIVNPSIQYTADEAMKVFTNENEAVRETVEFIPLPNESLTIEEAQQKLKDKLKLESDIHALKARLRQQEKRREVIDEPIEDRIEALVGVLKDLDATALGHKEKQNEDKGEGNRSSDSERERGV